MKEGALPQSVSSPLIWAMSACAVLYGFFTPNPLETVWSVALLLYLLQQYWWQNLPGVVLFCFLIPFIEIHTTVIEANNSGIPLDQLYPNTGSQTFWLSSIGLLFVAIGFQWGIRHLFSIRLPTIEQLKQDAEQISQSKLLVLAGASFLFSNLLDSFFGWGSSLRQLTHYSQGISNALLIATAIHFWLTRQRPWMMTALFIAFLASSFYSYFASWKDPFYIVLVSYLVLLSSFTFKHLLRLSPIILPMTLLVFTWQSIKTDYRAFLSGGERSQAIRVSRNDALNKFQELSTQAFENNTLVSDAVIDATYKRIGYLEYFNAAVAKVPSEIPYEGGKLLNESVTFAFIPRILSPNKGEKNDRLKVERYTDFYFGESSFSSFSLGHYCEAYIDWGPNGMMLHLLLYGALGALMITFTFKRTTALNSLLAMGILWAILFPWGTFQQDMVTTLGRSGWGTFSHLVIFLPIYRWASRFIAVDELKTTT